MPSEFSVFVGLFNNLAIFIVLVAIYAALVGRVDASSGLRGSALLGFFFGLFAIACMYAKIPVTEGVIVDQRNAVVALSGFFGGPLAALISGAMAASYRVHLGGAGAFSGVVGVILAGTAGAILYGLRDRIDSLPKAVLAALFATLSILPGFLLFGDLETGWALLKAVALPYGTAVFLGILLVGLLLALGERRYHAVMAQAAMAERLRDFAKSASDWFWETDAQHRFVFESGQEDLTAGLRLDAFGAGPDAAGRAAEPPDAEQRARFIALLDKREEFRGFLYSRALTSGRARQISISGVPFFDAQGRFRGFRGTSNDVTEKAALEEQVRRAQRMEAVGQLTGGVAHDFNNLLGVVVGNVELLEDALRDKAADPRVSERLARLNGALDRGASLTQRLLAFSRQQPLQPKPTDLGAQVADLEDLLRRTLGETVDLQVEIDKEVWPAMIDGAQLDHALINLAVNARDAMPQGGRLTVEARNCVLDEAYVSLHDEVRPGAYVKLSVSDNGSGIDPADLEHVFEPFFTTKEVGQGSGLGLSMVYGFAKQSSGHITIYSEPGRGTTVSLFLPRSEQAARAQGDVVREPRASSGGGSVLIVEDDPAVRAIPAGILAGQGYRVMQAASGREALDLLAGEGSIVLLFTDIVLPGGMNGVEIAREAIRLQPHLKVLYTTGYAEGAVLHNGEVGKDALLLSKPYRRLDLLLKVEEALGESATASSAHNP